MTIMHSVFILSMHFVFGSYIIFCILKITTWLVGKKTREMCWPLWGAYTLDYYCVCFIIDKGCNSKSNFVYVCVIYIINWSGLPLFMPLKMEERLTEIESCLEHMEESIDILKESALEEMWHLLREQRPMQNRQLEN